MEDLTKKLSELLSTPEGMDKIKTVMGMFLDSNSNNDKQETEALNQQTQDPQEGEQPISKIAPVSKNYESNTLGFNLNNPAMMSKISRVFEVMNTKDDSRVNLLMSLRPFLGQSRSSRLDHAVKMLQISKISNMMKK